MTQYNSSNVKLSNSQFNKLKLAIKNEAEVVSRLTSNMIANSDDETNFAQKLLLLNRQVIDLGKAFANNLPVNFKLSKPQLSKTVHLGARLGRLLDSLLQTGLPIMKNVLQTLAISVLIPLGLAAALSVADAGILKKILGLGTTTLIISNDKMEDNMKIVS